MVASAAWYAYARNVPRVLCRSFRYTVLHDGRYQVMILCKWLERSPESTAPVDFVLQSLRVAP